MQAYTWLLHRQTHAFTHAQEHPLTSHGIQHLHIANSTYLATTAANHHG